MDAGMPFLRPISDRYFEDYIEGDVHRFGTIAVEADEIVVFANRFDPQTLHTDPEAAKSGPFGGLIASGWHTAGLMTRLFMDHYLTKVASLGSPGGDELRWVKPVRQTPQRYQQLARQCHDHCRLARAARTLGPRAIPPRQRTVFLEHQEAPRQLDQPTSYPRIAGLGQALLSAFQTALIGRSREPGIARQRSSISKIARQDLPHQHVRRLDTDTDHPGEQPHHRMRPGIRCTLEPLGTCLLDRADLLTDQCQPCHVAPELLDDVCRQARALRGPQTCQTLWSLTQMWLESPDPETGKRTLHAVDDA